MYLPFFRVEIDIIIYVHVGGSEKGQLPWPAQGKSPATSFSLSWFRFWSCGGVTTLQIKSSTTIKLLKQSAIKNKFQTKKKKKQDSSEWWSSREHLRSTSFLFIRVSFKYLNAWNTGAVINLNIYDLIFYIKWFIIQIQLVFKAVWVCFLIVERLTASGSILEHKCVS